MKNNKSTLLLVVLLLVALAGAMVLSRQSTETRKGAFFAGTKVILQPGDIQKNVGEAVLVDLFLETANEAKADFIETKICYGDKLKIEGTASEKITLDANFTDVMKAKLEQEDTAEFNSCLTLAAKSEKAAVDLKSGTVRVGQIKFVATRTGEGVVSVVQDKTTVSGFNPVSSSTDSSLEITEVVNTNYLIGTGGGNGPTNPPSASDPYLNFKMVFAGVTPQSQCANSNVQVMVMGPDGTKKTYNNVALVREGVAGGLAVYKGSVRLSGFPYSNGVSAFIKGSKHLQVKYGVGGQDKFYNKSGGELLGLTNDAAASPTFDFTKYPLLAGDVTGETAGVQDGVVDGRDFSFIKAEVGRGGDGNNLPADLNGNCSYESQDTALFMVSLKEKQGQLY